MNTFDAFLFERQHADEIARDEREVVACFSCGADWSELDEHGSACREHKDDCAYRAWIDSRVDV